MFAVKLDPSQRHLLGKIWHREHLFSQEIFPWVGLGLWGGSKEHEGGIITILLPQIHTQHRLVEAPVAD